MKTGLAPIYIQPLIELHCSPAKENHHYFERKRGLNVKSDLVEWGLIELKNAMEASQDYIPSEYQLTERGTFYVLALTNLPLPQTKWFIPGGVDDE